MAQPQTNTSEIASAYATFGVQVAILLEKITSPEHVQLWLKLKYSRSDPASFYMYYSLGLDNSSQSLSQVLHKLIEHTTWFEYDHLTSLAIGMGGEEGKRLVEEYERKLNAFQSTPPKKYKLLRKAQSTPNLTPEPPSPRKTQTTPNRTPELSPQEPAQRNVPASSQPTALGEPSCSSHKILVSPKKSKKVVKNELQNSHHTLSQNSAGLSSSPTPTPPTTDSELLKPHSSLISFSTLILTRASEEATANLQMTAIRGHQPSRPGEVGVEQGEHLTALYQRKGATYIVTKNGESGFIPSNICFLSSVYQKDPSKVRIFSKKHLTQLDNDRACPTTTTTVNPPITYKPIQMMVIQQYTARYTTELSVHRGEFISVLFYDDQWVYGITEKPQAGFVPSSYCRLK